MSAAHRARPQGHVARGLDEAETFPVHKDDDFLIDLVKV